MSKSLEALNRIETMFPLNKEEKANYYNQFTSSIQPFYEDFNLVKQDLEKLELIEALYNKSLKEMENIKDVDRELYLKYKALENENANLKQYPLEIDGMFYSFEGLVERNNKLQNENQDLIKKVEHYREKFYKTHKQAEQIKEIIREFLNDLSFMGFLKNDNYGDIPLKVVFNAIIQTLERLEMLEKENQELIINKNLAQGIALKYKKVIEIIKNKCISNSNLWLVYNSKNYIDYECFVKNKDHELVRIEHNILTEKEFDLLKEVLE